MALQYTGRVLVVDPDYDVLAALADALRTRGHQVVLATDGRTGVQRAVEVAADVVVVDENVSSLDARTFLEVLRDNPRTSGAQVFVMGEHDPAHLVALGTHAEPIVKPFNSDEVAARIEEVIRARHAPRPEPELEGDLSQVAVFDLLQVFAANRRTGKLRIEAASAGAGEVWVEQGAVVDARIGAVGGEKALYRVLSLRSGRFLFVPDAEAPGRRIEASTDQLLMEAVRQTDEIARLREELPSPGAQVSLSSWPAEPSAVAQPVLACLDEPRTIGEVLDLVPASDLAVYEALHELTRAGALLVLDAERRHTRLCAGEEVAALRAAALRLRRRGVEGAVRLPFIASSAAEIRSFARALSSVREFVPASRSPSELGDSAFGPVGSIRLDGTELELFALPFDTALRPLWGPFVAPCTVVLALSETGDAQEVLKALDVRTVAAPCGWQSPSGAVAALRTALGTDESPRTPLPNAER